MEEYENWIGALSGKIKSIAPGGIVELESAGIQVFEVKAKEAVVKSSSEPVAPAENKPGASDTKVEAKVSSSKARDEKKQNRAEKKENSESSAQKNQTPEAILQAVGVIEGEVESIDNKLKVSIGGESFSPHQSCYKMTRPPKGAKIRRPAPHQIANCPGWNPVSQFLT